ncbi:MAG TPA: hypothetical protein PKN80_00880 [bacterium]|nr:hypothetical protein [bacterium]HNS49270.1 hypothetical protein [bacterium]
MIRKLLCLTAVLFCFGGRPAAAVNLIPNSGFETGAYRLWVASYQSARLVDDSDLDFQVFHDGTASLRLTAWSAGTGYSLSPFLSLTSAFTVPVPGAGTYTLSAWVKSDRKLNFNLACGAIKIQVVVLPEEGWRRVTASGPLDKPEKLAVAVSGSDYDPNQLHAGHLWLDSLQLEAGETAGAYAPAGPELRLVCLPPANIFHDSGPVEVLLRGVNPTGRDVKVDLEGRLWDCFGREFPVTSARASFLLKKDGVSEFKYAFPKERKGVFRFQVLAREAGGGTFGSGLRMEIPFYVVPRPDPDGWNPFGLYLQLSVPGLERATRLGLYWNNTLSSAGATTEWKKIYARDQYWFEAYLPYLKAARDRYRMRFVGCVSDAGFIDVFPKMAEAEKSIPGETIDLESANGPRYLKISAFREYLQTMARHYSPYIKYWQMIDEVPFGGPAYLQLMVEGARALKSVDPKAVLLATYPRNAALAYVRGGPESTGGLYDLGRELGRVRYSVKAADLAGPDFPLFFYDCSVLMNYHSDHFNGWGKFASRLGRTAEGVEVDSCLSDFTSRFNDTLVRNLRPAGGGGPRVKAVIIYHGRLPGGGYQSTFDLWGHLDPSIVALGCFNGLTAAGASEGELGLPWEGFVFSLGQGKGKLLAVMPGKPAAAEVEVPSGLNLRQLDIWGNDITLNRAGKRYLALVQPYAYVYLTLPDNQLAAAREFLAGLAASK